MIYVRRDPSAIPEKVLRVAQRAQEKLEQLPATERVEFIKKKSHIWRAFGRHLSRMSYGKCWYSESTDPQSFFDIDHFRPKAEAQRAEKHKDDGYPWLAFSWINFRYAAQRSNRLSTNEETEATEGKGSWFPLLNGSPIATWADRCTDDEKPVLLDPTVRQDVDLIDVNGEGAMEPSLLCTGTGKMRVERSIELYGLNLPGIASARKRAMREIIDLHTSLLDVLAVAVRAPDVADELPIPRQVDQLRRATMPLSAYSKAARAQLRFLPGGHDLCAKPEDLPAPS